MSDKSYCIVTTKSLVQQFKKSKHFTQILGKVTTMAKDNGERELIIDGFVKKYYDKTGCLILSEGNVGRITFFTNHYLKENIISVFDETGKSLDLLFEQLYVNSMSIEHYLLEVMEEFENTHYPKEKVEEKAIVTTEKEKTEDEEIKYLESLDSEEILINAPYAAKWEDVKKYLEKKRGVR